jgi:BirA family transcriptional regulator, biotin operon repressor / biotin---[acetyl-CoA-carboxylase] ligase
MATRLGEWSSGPFAPIRAAWLKRARGVGGEIVVRLPNRTIGGWFEALDDHGRLLLRLADGRLEIISAGDVFFGPAR